eukprot:12366775-Alexandrium_andersonii.AAC.1
MCIRDRVKAVRLGGSLCDGRGTMAYSPHKGSQRSRKLRDAIGEDPSAQTTWGNSAKGCPMSL